MCSTKNVLSMLHVWLMTCWKWWIFTFPEEYWNSTLGHCSNNIFFGTNYIFWLPGYQSITNRQEKKPKNHQYVFTADEKNVRNCAHWEHQCKNHPIFYLFNTDTNTVTNMNSGTDMDTATGTGMATSTASETTTDTDMAMNTGTTTDKDTDCDWHGHEHGNAHWHWHGHCRGYAWTQPRRTYTWPRGLWHVQIYGHGLSHRHWTWLDDNGNGQDITDN